MRAESMHISEALAEAAWERYEEASAKASRILRGEQIGLFETSMIEAREWKGIALACEVERLSHG